VFSKAIQDLDRFGFDGLSGKRVLDLGCGERFHFALLCAGHGAQVAAIDIEYVAPDFIPLAFLRAARHDGVKRAARFVLRRLLFDSRYYHSLEDAAGMNLRSLSSRIDFGIVSDDATMYPFRDESFDLIASNAVLEHVADVPHFASEVVRLLKPGGYFYAIAHNYYSISGGHRPEWSQPDVLPAKEIPPWDHLRKNQYPTRSHLNRYSPEQYADAFSPLMQMLLFEGRDAAHNPAGQRGEGEQFLTAEVASELSAYPRELLLTRAWCLICKKPLRD
jgi:SAM-dependent methyltransferase